MAVSTQSQRPNGPQTNGVADGGPSTRIDTIDTAGGRILCVADIRGKLSQLNQLAAEHNAKAIIHSGDFGFFDSSSLQRISERTLKHLVQYSNLITPSQRPPILAANSLDAMRNLINQASTSQNAFALSEFPKLLTGELKLAVPVYTVYGACEDVAILERIRAAPAGPVSVPSAVPFPAHATSGPAHAPSYSIPNLTVLSEGCTRSLLIGGVRLRLFGLGGALVPHKFFDNGEGQATIAGGGGTMWTTILQIGELVDTAQRVYDITETRLLVTHSSPGREGLLAQLALALKADLTISAGLHFRYGVSYNEYSVCHDADAFRNKLLASKLAFTEVWDTVKGQVDQVIDDTQRKYLDNALAVTNRLPAEPTPGQPSSVAHEEPAWKNSWNWNLPDATYGSLVLDVREGRFSSEMRSQGFNFAYRAAQSQSQGGQARGPAPNKAPAAPSPAASTSAPKPTTPAPAAANHERAPSVAKSADATQEPSRPTSSASRGGGPPRGGGRGGNHSRNSTMVDGDNRLTSSAGGAEGGDTSTTDPTSQGPPSQQQTGGNNKPYPQGEGGRGRGRGGRGRGDGDGSRRGSGEYRGRGSFRGRGGGAGNNSWGPSSNNNSNAGTPPSTSAGNSTPAAAAPPAPAANGSSEPPW